MKKIVKVWMLAVLLGGTAADLCAQTVWHDPEAERPQSAQRMQPATDGSQTVTERYIRFITNAPSVEIRYQMAGTGGVRPCRQLPEPVEWICIRPTATDSSNGAKGSASPATHCAGFPGS